MSEKRKRDTVPRIGRAQIRYQRWISRAYGFAAFCLAALAILEVTDMATPFLQTILMLGIVAAGTGAWVLQAKRQCPKCGTLYGYHFRIVNANVCHKCGAEFPKWRPGMEDGERASE